MATEFDLSSLKKGQKAGNSTGPTSGMTKDRDMEIPIPAPKNPDPIFDTPPVKKIPKNDGEILSINENNSTTVNRTPITPGKPTAPHHGPVHGDEPVDDPQPLKVMNNMTHTPTPDQMQPFDINSLPKKKKPIGQDEEDVYDSLEEAVNREMESISERMKALTEKQYEEYLEARQEGKTVARPMTDEEVEAQMKAEVAAKSQHEEKVVDTNEEVDGLVNKRIVIRDEDDEEPETVVEFSKQDRIENFVGEIADIIPYVKQHHLRKDVFSKALFAKEWLYKHGVYASLYGIVMYNHENEAKVHPILVAEKDDITAIIEVNETGCTGIHILDPNDTVESVCYGFVHKGLLYDYIDYLAKTIVIKFPVDKTPSEELAIQIAENKSEEVEPMDEVKNETHEEEIPVEENAIVEEEADSLAEMDSTPVTATVKVDDQADSYDEDHEAEIENAVLPDEEEEENYDDTPADITLPSAEDIKSETGYSEDDEPLVIKKSAIVEEPESHDDENYETDLSEDIQNDLNRELGTGGPSDEEILDELRSAVKEHSNSIKKKINLREFKISDTPISAAQVATFSIKDVNQADWVLPNAKRVITVRGLSGPELFSMNPQNSNKNKINTFRQIYGIIYRHVVSKKPKTFDEWLKITRFSDIDHIYAALHKATFAGSNFVHYECPECHHIFIQDYDFDKDMVVYADDKAKNKIQSIMRSNDTSFPDYDVELRQISDRYVVGLKDPSIWNMVMETAALSDDFLSKYEDLIDTMSFIDSIYLIGDGELRPVDFGYDKENPAKSTARKITILSDIIRTLSSDNYFALRGYIAKLFATSNDISYQIPAAKCPKCNHEFDAEPSEAMRILFTRHQLGALEVI